MLDILKLEISSNIIYVNYVYIIYTIYYLNYVHIKNYLFIVLFFLSIVA